MGTYDNSCGAALHNPDFDRGDDITDAESEVLGLLEEAQTLDTRLAAVKDELKACLERTLNKALPLGSLVGPRAGLFGDTYVPMVKSRDAVDYEVAGPAVVEDLNIPRPARCRFRVPVYPVDASTSRLSTAVWLFGYLGVPEKAADPSSSNDQVCELVRKVALAGAPQVECAAPAPVSLPAVEAPVAASNQTPSAPPAPGFGLNSDEAARFEAWAATKPRSGAVDGAQFQFSFLPTSIGLITKVTCLVSGDVLDLTDYASW